MCPLRLRPKMDLHQPIWLLSRNDPIKDSVLQEKGILKERRVKPFFKGGLLYPPTHHFPGENNYHQGYFKSNRRAKGRGSRRIGSQPGLQNEFQASLN